MGYLRKARRKTGGYMEKSLILHDLPSQMAEKLYAHDKDAAVFCAHPGNINAVAVGNFRFYQYCNAGTTCPWIFVSNDKIKL